jgi:hypothetical protein
MTKSKRPSVASKFIVITVIAGGVDALLELTGHPLSEARRLDATVAGFGVTILWVLDDLAKTVESISEELRKRSSAH